MYLAVLKHIQSCDIAKILTVKMAGFVNNKHILKGLSYTISWKRPILVLKKWESAGPS